MASKRTLWVIIIVLLLTAIVSLVLSQVLSSMLSPKGGNSAWQSPVPTDTTLPTFTLEPTPTDNPEPLLTTSPVITVSSSGPDVPSAVLTMTVVPGSCTYPMIYWRSMPELLPEYVKIEYISFSRADAVVLMNTDPKYVAINLFQQYYAALMNVRVGTDPSPIQQALDDSYTWLYEHSFGSTLEEEDAQKASELVKTLESYNNGQTGPGLCADAPPTLVPTQTITRGSCTFPMTYWREQPDLLPDYLKIEYITFSRSDAILLMNSNPKYVSIDLFQQYYAAYVNTKLGADPTDIQDELEEARQWLYEHSFGSTLTEEAMKQAFDLARTLEYFNNGQIGPGLCATEAELTATAGAIQTVTANAPTRTPRPTILLTATNTPVRSEGEPRATAVQPSPTQAPPTNTPEPPTAEPPTNTPRPPTAEPPTPTDETTPTIAPPLRLSAPKVFPRVLAEKLSAIDSEMQIAKSAEPNPVVAGNLLTYTVTVFNHGDILATGVMITDTLPSGATFQSASPGCSHDAGQVICDIGEMITQTEQSRTIIVRVGAEVTGSLTNLAQVGSTSPDPNPGNNTATVDTIVNTQADLQLSKSATPGTVIAGNLLTYTLSLNNSGPSNALGVIITDTLPSGITFQSASGCSQAANQVICNIGSLAANVSANRTIVVRVNTSTTEALLNSATAGTATTDPDLDNNLATVNTTVNAEADLQLNKTGTPTTVIAGNLLTYTLSLLNDGPSNASGITISDDLPASVTFQSASAGCSHTAGQVVCNLASLAASSSANRTITVRVNPATTITPQTNLAVVDAATTDPITNNNTASVNTIVTTEADLQLSKSGSSGTVVAGNLLTYTLSLSNAGPSSALDVAINDTLPSGVTFQSASAGCSHAAGQVVCNLASLAASSSANRTIVVRVSTSTLGALLNSATASAATADPNTGNNSATANTAVNTRADLQISKSASSPVIAGNLLTYTLTLNNIGPSDALNVTIVDTLPSGVTFQSASPGCDYNSGQVVCDLESITGATSTSRTILTRVNSSTTNFINNIANVSSSTFDPVNSNNQATLTTNVSTSADLALTVDDVPEAVPPGAALAYTIQVANIGPSDARNVVVTSTLPTDFTPGTPSFPCVLTTIMTCNLGTIPAGQNSQVSLPGTVSPAAPLGTISLFAGVKSTTADPQAGNNQETETTDISNEIANLQLTLVDAPDPVIAGNILTYQGQISNLGPSAASGVVFTSTIPGSSSFQSASAGQGNCAFSSQLTCNIGDIANGSQVTVTFQVLVNAAATASSLENTATVDSAVPDSNSQNNIVSPRTVIQTQADLSITQTDNPDPVNAGMALTYTLRVDNAGPSNALGVKVVDTLPAGVQFIASVPGLPTCVNVNNQITCNLGALAAGASTQVSVRVQVNAQTVGQISNQATLSSYTADGNAENNASTENTQVSDKTPPTVIWVLPVTNTHRYDVFNEMVLLQVTAGDNVGVEKVVFYRHDPVMGKLIIGEDTTVPYECTVDASTLNFEWNQITALAYDTSGNVSVFDVNDPNASYIWLYRTISGYKVYLPIIIR